MKHPTRPDVARVFRSYPEDIRDRLLHMREMILEVVADLPDAGDLEETLKWGEPSYLVKAGSTVRLGWKASRPEHYAVYFNCNTRLVDTFREVYRDRLKFEGNRAIVFHRDDTVPTSDLKHCLALALQYHRLKHLPLLGL